MARNDLMPKNPNCIYKFSGTNIYKADVTKEPQYIKLEVLYNELLCKYTEEHKELLELRIKLFASIIYNDKGYIKEITLSNKQISKFNIPEDILNGYYKLENNKFVFDELYFAQCNTIL